MNNIKMEKKIKYIWENKVYDTKPEQINDYMEYEEYIGEDGYYYRNYMEKDGIRLVKKVMDLSNIDVATKTEKSILIRLIIVIIGIIGLFWFSYYNTKKIKEEITIKNSILQTQIKENNKLISGQIQRIDNIANTLNTIDINTLNKFIYLYREKIDLLYNKKIKNGPK